MEITELRGSEAGILGNRSHRKSVDRIVTRNREAGFAVAHDNVARLSCDPVA